MDDLISRQVLLAEQFASLECILQANKDAGFDVYKRGWNDALQTVYDNAPSADAVEIVRCRDCKHKHRTEYAYNGMVVLSCYKTYDFNGFSAEVEPNHFCSYGERKIK